METWLKDAKDNISNNAVLVLIGSKSDLDDVQREVTYEQGMELMSKLHMDLFFETSAKMNVEVERMFSESTKRIIAQNAIIS